MKTPFLYCCLAAACLSLPQSRQGIADDDRRLQAAGPQVIIQPISGRAVNGRMISLDDQSLSLRDSRGKSQSWNTHAVRSISIGPPPKAMAEVPPLVILANDDVLCGSISSGDEDTLTVDWTAVAPPQPVTVPLEHLRSIAFQQPGDDLDRIRLRRIWAMLEPSDDRLISVDNTHIDGEFSGVSEGRVFLKSVLGKFSTPVEEVVAVVMNSELLSRSEPEGAYLLLLFRDGSRVTCSSLQSAEDGQWTAHTVWGSEIRFPLGRLSRVQFLGGRVIALSTLEPADYKFTPYLTQVFPLVTNRNVKGGRLRIRGDMYSTGVGVSSKSEITYDLRSGGYVRFDAVVGIDDMTGGQGNVVFAVELDGRRVYESKPLGGRSPAEAVGPINVSAAKSLKLVVEFGRSGNIQDVANWCDAVLTKRVSRE